MKKNKPETAFMVVQVQFAGTVEEEDFVKDDKWYTQERPLTLDDFSGDFTWDQDKAIAEVLEELATDGISGGHVTAASFTVSVLGFYKTLPRNKLY